jgi:hypothetical protein
MADDTASLDAALGVAGELACIVEQLFANLWLL